MTVFKKTRRNFLTAILTLATGMLTASCVHEQKKEIIVSAAISLKNAFEEIGSVYEKQTGVRPKFNFAASGILQRQIESGAPVDVFAVAGRKQMDDVQQKGLLFDETRKDFARNSLILITPADSDLEIHSFYDLADVRVERISIGNPKTVPVGQYAQEALTALELWDKLQSKLIPAENARQVLDYVSRGEVNAGLIYTSDAAISEDRIRVAAEAPGGSHEEITYQIAVLKDSASSTAATGFIELILSKTGQAILAKYGFTGAGLPGTQG